MKKYVGQLIVVSLLLPSFAYGMGLKRWAKKSRKSRESCQQSIISGVASLFPDLLFDDCYGEREIAPERDFGGAYDVASDFILSDQAACDCYAKSFSGLVAAQLNFLSRPLEKDRAKREEELKFMIIESNLKHKSRYLQSMSDGMLIQAHFLSAGESNEKRMKFLGQYAEKVDGPTKEIVKKYKDSLNKAGGDELNFKTNKNKFRSLVESIHPPKELSENTLPKDEIPRNPVGACFSMKTYLAWQQRPKNQDFVQQLRSENFQEESWALSSLRKQYDEAYKQFDAEVSNKEARDQLEMKVKALKDRILFLKNNPLYANLFAASGENLNEEEKSELQRQKAALHGLLKQKYAENGQDEARINNEIRKIFDNAVVWAASRGHLNKSIQEEYNSGLESILNQKLPRTQPGLQNKFEAMTKESVRSCSKMLHSMPEQQALQERMSCAKNFPLYCQLVKNVHDNFKKDGEMFVRPSDDLEAELLFDYDPDPATNKGFKELTEKLCKSKKLNKDGLGQGMNFREWKEQYCQDQEKSNPEACKKDKLLLARYLKLTSSDNTEVAFANFVGKLPDVDDLSSEELAGVKKNSVSAAFIREHGARAAYVKAFEEGQAPLPHLGASQNPPDENSEDSRYPTGIFAPPPFHSVNEVANITTPDLAPLGQEAVSEVLREKEELKRELNAKKVELPKTTDVKDRTSLNKQIQDLEARLAKKDAEYRRLINEQNKKIADATHDKGESSPKAEGGEDTRGQQSFVAAAASGGSGGHGSASRALPSVGHTGNFDAPRLPTSSGVGTSDEVSKLNKALLAKYGISVVSVDGSFVVASANEASQLEKLKVAHQDEGTVNLVVSFREYAQLKDNEVDSLENIYLKNMKPTSGEVVKFSITTDGESLPLEYYAFREEGKLVILPVRKVTRNALLEALPKE